MATAAVPAKAKAKAKVMATAAASSLIKLGGSEAAAVTAV
jgi:hypothetical protein